MKENYSTLHQGNEAWFGMNWERFSRKYYIFTLAINS